jgi:isopentenyldiphosphate isomerase
MNSAEEIVALVDEHNQVVGAAPRREMRARKLPHRASFILVFNARGELYVQRRTMTKDIYPGRYDPATGGVVLAGESYEENAVRELAEELGIHDVPLQSHGDFYFADADVKVCGRVFSCQYDGKVILQAEEVESVSLMTLEQILQSESPGAFASDSLAAVRCYVH